MEQTEMKKEDVINNLEVLDIKLEGLTSVLRLISEANTNNDDGYNELNAHAYDVLSDVVEDMRLKHVKTSITSLFEKETK